MKRTLQYFYDGLRHLIGRATSRYYVEDFVRVYPDGVLYDRLGRRRSPDQRAINNYLNHRKFYDFASQFVRGRVVADIGCGSGYGCEILKKNGARHICGADISRRAIRFAKLKYGASAEFSVQGITDLGGFHDGFFDISVCSEVLEHIKEYKLEDRALRELKRITRCGGLIVIGTPNSEMLDDHGFRFDEITVLLERHFKHFCIFENALQPFGEKERARWDVRQSEGRTGIIITELVNLSETVLPDHCHPEIKHGSPAGQFRFGDFTFDTTLLHNTHSWLVLALDEEP